MQRLLAEEWVPLVDPLLEPYRTNIKNVYRSGVLAVDVDMFPCIQLGSPQRTSKKWFSTGFSIQEDIEIDIMGYVIHDDADRNVDILLLIADSLNAFFEEPERFHLVLPGLGFSLFYDPDEGVVPVAQLSTETEIVGDGDQTVFLRSFSMPWRASYLRTLGYPALGCDCPELIQP